MLAFAAALVTGGPCIAQSPQAPSVMAADAATGFEAYKTYLQQRARGEGISENVVQTISQIRLSQRAIELDRAQRPGNSSAPARSGPLRPYLEKHVTRSLIWRGQDRYHHHWPHLYRIQSDTGVDAPTLLAIFGKETSYGAVTGSFDLLTALASLAYEGRRRQLFETEFLAALKLLDLGIARERLVGSYAGATGFPQFMPTAVLRLRTDGDRDGHADIWTNEIDALASIANYLHTAGWKKDLPWGAPVLVSAGLDRGAIALPPGAEGCSATRRHSRRLPIARWKELGVTMSDRPLPDDAQAALIEPTGAGERAYLVTDNFLAILNYNCSNAYAMSVALLSDAIARRTAR